MGDDEPKPRAQVSSIASGAHARQPGGISSLRVTPVKTMREPRAWVASFLVATLVACSSGQHTVVEPNLGEDR
jgi:hypothetical protein